jgi:hypothetical protein
MKNHQALINTIRYSDMPNGTAVIKMGDQLIQAQITRFSCEMEPNSHTQIKIEAVVNEV